MQFRDIQDSIFLKKVAIKIIVIASPKTGDSLRPGVQLTYVQHFSTDRFHFSRLMRQDFPLLRYIYMIIIVYIE